jgi:hypothetical protein
MIVAHRLEPLIGNVKTMATTLIYAADRIMIHLPANKVRPSLADIGRYGTARSSIITISNTNPLAFNPVSRGPLTMRTENFFGEWDRPIVCDRL